MNGDESNSVKTQRKSLLGRGLDSLLQPPAAAHSFEAFAGLLKDRFSCRAYESTPVPRATIEAVLTAAQRTPSWCNTQPWQVSIVSGTAKDALSQQLYEAAKRGVPPNPEFDYPRAYVGEYRERRKVCGVQLYQSLGIGREDKARAAEQSLENFKFFGAPHVAFITSAEALGFYGGLDCGLYVMSFLLAAQALGLGAIAQAALASYPDVVRRNLGYGDDRRLVCGIAFGIPTLQHPINGYRTERAPLTECVSWFE